MPASVIGTSTSPTTRRTRRPSSTTIAPSLTVVARPPWASTSRSAGCSAWTVVSQIRPVAARRICRTRGSSAFSTSHPSGRVNPRDQALHLGELIHGVDPVQVEVVGAHVRHHGDVVVPHADPPQEDAAACRLEHGHIGVGGQGDRRTAEPRVVPVLDPARPPVDAVGRRVRHPQPGGRDQVREQPRRGGLPVRPGHLDHGDRRVGDGGLGPGLGGADAGGELGHHAGGRAAGTGRHRASRGAAERLGGAAPAPRERHHDHIELVAGTRADREPVRAGGDREASRVRGADPTDDPLPLLAPRPAGLGGAADAERLTDTDDRVLACALPPGHADRELDRGSREVQVRAVEDPELDQLGGGWGGHDPRSVAAGRSACRGAFLGRARGPARSRAPARCRAR